MEIRDASDEDWPAIWRMVQEVLAEGEAYTYEPGMTADSARAKWLAGPPWHTTVAVEDEVLAVATFGPNQSGPGSHISNANFVAARSARGRGIGTHLVEDTIERARAAGYAGMQFNAVVETNPAVAMYQRVGFDIIGTVPGAFIHPRLGPVGLHVMYLAF